MERRGMGFTDLGLALLFLLFVGISVLSWTSCAICGSTGCKPGFRGGLAQEA